MKEILDKPYIIFDAEPFCFGPISTTINLVSYLKSCTDIGNSHTLVLLGTGTSKQLATASSVFDIIIECNTTELSELERHKDRIFGASIYISTTNPHPITFLKNTKVPIFYIDTLFWMWSELRSNFKGLQKYFIQRFFNIDKQLDYFRDNISNPHVVSPLISHRLKKTKEDDYVLINLGGMDTVYHKTATFYDALVKCISQSTNMQRHRIVIAGGGKTIVSLREKYSRINLEIDCFGKRDFEELFTKCKKFISAPGLTSMHESYIAHKDVFFLPPQNYSQFLNLKYMQNGIKGIKSINYQELLNIEDIPERLPEEEGIALVKALSAKLSQNDTCMLKLISALEKFLEDDNNRIKLPDELAFTSSGVEEIATEILKLCRHPIAA